jgi:hypothetical protein
MKTLRFYRLTTFYPSFNFGGDGIDVKRTANALVRRPSDDRPACGAARMCRRRSRANNVRVNFPIASGKRVVEEWLADDRRAVDSAESVSASQKM